MEMKNSLSICLDKKAFPKPPHRVQGQGLSKYRCKAEALLEDLAVGYSGQASHDHTALPGVQKRFIVLPAPNHAAHIPL